MGGLMSRLVHRWLSASPLSPGLIKPSPSVSSSKSSDEFPTSVLLFTQNIARHPIAWDPAQQRPTQEVIHAVHSALHFALDTCVDHPGEALSFGVQDGVLTIPNKQDLKSKEPPRTGWEVHVKLFIYANAGQDYVRVLERSLSELREVVGATALESFVVSLSSVAWHGEKGVEAAGLDEVDGLVNLWKAISNRSELRNIGVADFSAEHLERLLALVGSQDSATPLRKPTINQVNLSPSAGEPTGLLELTKREGINLQTHADDLGEFIWGATKQMVGLLSEFEDRLPLSPAFIKSRNEESYDRALPMEWILKYTIFNQDRGIVGEKGYIVSAQIAK